MSKESYVNQDDLLQRLNGRQVELWETMGPDNPVSKGFDECFTMVEEFPHEKVAVKLTKQKISDVLYNYFNSGVYCWDCRNANDDTDDSFCFCHRKSMFWALSRGAADALADEILRLEG